MSLCRWSSDNWQCDLYVYEDVSGGITVHVARGRHSEDVPRVGGILELGADEWVRQYKAQKAYLEAHDVVPIGGPFDGESFYGLDDEECREKLTELRAAGYRFPDYVLEELALIVEEGA